MGEKTSLNVDTQELQTLYSSSRKAATLFDYLSSRERNYRETRPETLMLRVSQQSGFTFERSEMIRFLRSIENAGCGKYIEGRRGHNSRFVWHVRMSDVGRVAKGEQIEVSVVNGEETATMEPDGAAQEEAAITHRFYLRPNFLVEMNLPKDVRTTEAERIADWVKTLPFE